jgi:predicted ATPase
MEKPPPPIIIQNIIKYDLLKSSLEKQHINACIKIINNKNVKINLKSQNGYRKITRKLTEAGNTWYSYENKNTRPIRVMAKGIHPSCDPMGIIADVINRLENNHGYTDIKQ